MYSVVDIMDKMSPDWAEYLSAYEIYTGMSHYYGIPTDQASKERFEYVVTRLKSLHSRRKKQGLSAGQCLPFKAVPNPSLNLYSEAPKPTSQVPVRRVVYNKKAVA